MRRRLFHAPSSERGCRSDWGVGRRPGVDDVDFNVSHTEGCIACAIARNARVGVDVEARSRLPDIKEVALRFLSPCETRAVSRMANGPAETALLRLWTLKEALAKGIGVGMALDFRAIDLPADGHNDGSRFTSPSAKRWAFRTFGNYPMHVVAIAYRAPQECDVAVTYQTAVRAIGGSIS